MIRGISPAGRRRFAGRVLIKKIKKVAASHCTFGVHKYKCGAQFRFDKTKFELFQETVMKTAAKFSLSIVVATLALSFIVNAQETPASSLITGDRAGRIKLGMTIADARKAVDPLKLERTSDGEGIALIAVMRGKQNVMTIYAGEEDRDAKINENAKIEQIWVWDKNYRTEEGVKPGMKIADAEKIYGPAKEIVMSEIESREYVQFANNPQGLSFRVQGREDTAGKYQPGSNETAAFTPDAYIFSIDVVGRPADSGSDEPEFTSIFTDIRKGCKSVGGDEGGHVSSFCKGPENYQIHYFDAATEFQINAATNDRDWETPLQTIALKQMGQMKPVEWRLANGKPFAVLITDPSSGQVIAQGLKGFDRIKFEETGKGAIERARSMAEDEYQDIVVPAIPIDLSAGSTQTAKLEKAGDKVKYSFTLKKGDRLKVNIAAKSWSGEEGPIMVGIVRMPNGDSDGGPGGTIFDAAVDEDGEYQVLVYQNRAKSRSENIEVETTISVRRGE